MTLDIMKINENGETLILSVWLLFFGFANFWFYQKALGGD